MNTQSSIDECELKKKKPKANYLMHDLTQKNVHDQTKLINGNTNQHNDNIVAGWEVPPDSNLLQG